MERVKKFYQIVLLDEEYMLTAEEFTKLQEECREIAGYKNCSGKCHQVDHDTKEFDHVADEPDPLVEMNPEIEFEGDRFFLLTKSPHKAVAKVVEKSAELSAEVDEIIDEMVAPTEKVREQIDAEVVKEKVEAMPKKGRPPVSVKRDVTKYARMVQEGKPKDLIMSLMLQDKICADSSIKYFYKRAEAEAKDLPPTKTKPEPYITKVGEEQLTDGQILNAVYASNHTTIPIDICKQMATWGKDLDDKEIVFRASCFKGAFDQKDIIKAYNYTHPED